MHHIYTHTQLPTFNLSSKVPQSGHIISNNESIERVWATCVIILSVEKGNHRTKVDSDYILSARLLGDNLVAKATIPQTPS